MIFHWKKTAHPDSKSTIIQKWEEIDVELSTIQIPLG